MLKLLLFFSSCCVAISLDTAERSQKSYIDSFATECVYFILMKKMRNFEEAPYILFQSLKLYNDALKLLCDCKHPPPPPPFFFFLKDDKNKTMGQRRELTTANRLCCASTWHHPRTIWSSETVFAHLYSYRGLTVPYVSELRIIQFTNNVTHYVSRVACGLP